MKTLNLELMGVQEMNAREVKEVDGGFLFTLATSFAVIGLYTLLDEPERVWAGFKDAMN